MIATSHSRSRGFPNRLVCLCGDAHCEPFLRVETPEKTGLVRVSAEDGVSLRGIVGGGLEGFDAGKMG